MPPPAVHSLTSVLAYARQMVDECLPEAGRPQDSEKWTSSTGLQERLSPVISSNLYRQKQLWAADTGKSQSRPLAHHLQSLGEPSSTILLQLHVEATAISEAQNKPLGLPMPFSCK